MRASIAKGDSGLLLVIARLSLWGVFYARRERGGQRHAQARHRARDGVARAVAARAREGRRRSGRDGHRHGRQQHRPCVDQRGRADRHHEHVRVVSFAGQGPRAAAVAAGAWGGRFGRAADVGGVDGRGGGRIRIGAQAKPAADAHLGLLRVVLGDGRHARSSAPSPSARPAPVLLLYGDNDRGASDPHAGLADRRRSTANSASPGVWPSSSESSTKPPSADCSPTPAPRDPRAASPRAMRLLPCARRGLGRRRRPTRAHRPLRKATATCACRATTNTT